jgi:hypothetical protein
LAVAYALEFIEVGSVAVVGRHARLGVNAATKTHGRKQQSDEAHAPSFRTGKNGAPPRCSMGAAGYLLASAGGPAAISTEISQMTLPTTAVGL